MTLVTKHVLVRGEVQGVGFRYSLRSVAQQAGVNGWVRNKHDGSVEAVFHGDQNSVEKVIEWTRQGPPSSRVDQVDISDGVGDFHEFSIRDTSS